MKIKYILSTICLLLASFSIIKIEQNPKFVWKLNTSNVEKLKEYQRLFSEHHISLIDTQVDLDEVDADPMTVIAQKVSQVQEHVLIDDTSLDVEGADVGVNVRWLIDSLDQHVGKKAVWRTLLAYREGDSVFVYKGEIEGTISKPRGKGYGFSAVFIPKGSNQTLAEHVDDDLNSRALAVDAFVHDRRSAVVAAIYDWNGPWQH